MTLNIPCMLLAPISIYGLYHLFELQTRMSTCLLGVFFLMYIRHLNLIIFNMEPLTFPLKTLLSHHPHFIEWQLILPVSWVKKCGVFLDDLINISLFLSSTSMICSAFNIDTNPFYFLPPPLRLPSTMSTSSIV